MSDPTPEEHEARDALIEAVKLDARNSMWSDPRVWHEALEAALDKVLPGFWDAAAGFRLPADSDRTIAEAYGDDPSDEAVAAYQNRVIEGADALEDSDCTHPVADDSSDRWPTDYREPNPLLRALNEARQQGFRAALEAARGVDSDRVLARVKAELPEVVTLCGSTRFYDEFQEANYGLTMQGKIVLSVGFYPHAKARHGHGEGVGHDSFEKVALDELHKRKIDLSDRVLVLNVGGYIGASTRGEIEYAKSVGVPIDYLEPATERAARIENEATS